MNLHDMSLAELKKLKSDVDKAIDTYEQRMRKDALAELEAKAKELGFTLSDLVSGAPSKRIAKVAPKYRHPENPNVTWTGRGRQPKWVEEQLSNGQTNEDKGDYATYDLEINGKLDFTKL